MQEHEHSNGLSRSAQCIGDGSLDSASSKCCLELQLKEAANKPPPANELKPQSAARQNVFRRLLCEIPGNVDVYKVKSLVDNR
ncbi:hypothetical protein MJO28_013341 [Puccinia striiformis f. sp. tritici]|uniref:Uncharacterized protein n=1 Tax=Puccinia striiformis f. sp. tritici TaxID=168172 RepID=A0ACC0DYH6_9BASI|nr:hypothetical protein Pst134EA_024204 [Puccinia striiformis f. sp. tritici]KAI9606660.1 hypothetical protein H4Q26_006196 [Puccinia striiformis f. sp. tritici PST-130]KAH9444628.1 hypothetical protein Pst134EB_024888 [Puccinia striiformis f. sp. tritici]KAH9453325.1 hypothetical protein Pst134EA_024204 [Puccinia striiformis f. sp. tritici]KAI7941056.1 hypothetical protein MJO28_013341 [Puccinia striiformis f. sp. tritici]KAI7942908.1 hypothetical protein MJO29_012752 [Puccinia striiformis f.